MSVGVAWFPDYGHILADIFWQRQLYIDKSYMVLDIFRSRWQNIDMNRAEILA